MAGFSILSLSSRVEDCNVQDGNYDAIDMFMTTRIKRRKDSNDETMWIEILSLERPHKSQLLLNLLHPFFHMDLCLRSCLPLLSRLVGFAMVWSAPNF